MGAFSACLALFTQAASTNSAVVGEIRVQFLSRELVRIEQRGPNGFEDRPTFLAVNRNWPQIKAKTTKVGDATKISSGNLVVTIDDSKPGLSGVTVTNGKATAQLSQDNGNMRRWLPTPSKLPGTFILPDKPRMIPPKWGATPAPDNTTFKETNGFDTTNDAPDVYVFLPKTYTEWRKDFLHLTGPVPMVPKYALGFWDSRYHPYTEQEALDTIDKYRQKKIPLDLFVVDTDWRVGASDGYAPSTKYFPDMGRFLKEAHDRNVKVMFNDHPEPQTPTALDPKETKFRWDGLTSMFDLGLDAWWFDRNWWTSLHEPMPGISKEVWGQEVFHDITQKFYPDRRPLIMTNVEGIDNGYRSGPPSAAGHRYPIWWTGDTQSQWQFLQFGVENAVDSGVMSLMPYVGEDLGGHVGQPSDELYVRYLQYGTLSPTARIHCTQGNIRYPWTFGPEAERLVTDSIRFRYRLVPTLYEASRQAYETGTPLLRRLDLEFPKSPEAASNHQYMLGDDLLVAPVIESHLPQSHAIADLLRTNDGQPGLTGEYFDNQDLNGTPVLTRIDSNVRFNWHNDAPGPNVPSDHFSTRWTGKIGPMPKSMTYQFTTLSDDGARIFIDGKPVVDAWRDLFDITNSGTIALEAGKTYDIRVEFYDKTGGAHMELGWYGSDGPSKEIPKSPVWVPPGTWIDPYTDNRIVGPKQVQMPAPLAKIPMLVRNGAIVLLGDVVQYTDLQRGGPMTAEIYPSAKPTTRRFYEDDGLSNDYLKGKSYARTLSATAGPNAITVNLAKGIGTYKGAPKARNWTLRLHLPANWSRAAVTMNGKPIAVSVEKPKGPATGVKTIFQAAANPVLIIRLQNLPENAPAKIIARPFRT